MNRSLPTSFAVSRALCFAVAGLLFVTSVQADSKDDKVGKDKGSSAGGTSGGSAPAIEASYWDNGAPGANQGDWRNQPAAARNWVGDTSPASRSAVVFDDSYVSTKQTVNLRSEDKTVSAVYFGGQYSYDVGSTDGSKLIFQSDGNVSLLMAANNQNGGANNTISAGVQLNNDLVVANLANHTLAFSGTVNTGGDTLTVIGQGVTAFRGDVTGGGNLVKADVGLMEFDGKISLNTLTLGGGTLLLDTASLTATTLHVTGNSILDFGTGAGSVLNMNNLIVDAGVTLTIANWTNAVDFFYSQNAPSTANLTQVVFSGFGAAAWQSFDKQIKPVPEAGAYGAIFMGASVGFFGFLRWRRARQSMTA